MDARFGNDRLLATAYTLSRAGAWFGGTIILLSAILIGIDIVIRKAFAISIGGADELAGYSLAIGSIWAFGFALLHRAHIRIDSVYMLMPVPICAALDLAALLAFTGFFGFVGWHGYWVLDQTIVANTRSMSPLGTPLIIPQGLWILGFISMLATCGVLLLRSIQALWRRDALAIVRLVGSRTVEEEVHDEIAGLKRLQTEIKS
jgi:TRAP-type C4-dicarboxylate transport system permease small subunit